MAKRAPVSLAPTQCQTGTRGTVSHPYHLSVHSCANRIVGHHRNFRSSLATSMSLALTKQFKGHRPRLIQTLKTTRAHHRNQHSKSRSESSHFPLLLVFFWFPHLQDVQPARWVPAKLSVHQEIHCAGVVPLMFKNNLLPGQ